MGTETIYLPISCIQFVNNALVKLKNPLMGTETKGLIEKFN